jgi:hypothetical protein
MISNWRSTAAEQLVGQIDVYHLAARMVEDECGRRTDVFEQLE